MANPEEKFNRKRLRSSYFFVIVSITLVLVMLGLVGVAFISAKKITDRVRENIVITLYLQNNAKDAEVGQLSKSLETKKYVNSATFVSREEAAKMLQEDIGEDFVDFLGYNPLSPSIDVSLNAEYTHPDSLNWIEAEIGAYPKVAEISYPQDQVAAVNKNIRIFGLALLVFGAILFVIAFALINNSIRLAIYSKRFLIKSMQLVGATQGFIRRPFVMKGITHGFISAILSLIILGALLYLIQREFPGFFSFQDLKLIGSLAGIVIGLGVLISWISTTLAVRKFLRLKSDRLY